jgi:hypothetical protein
MIRAIAISLLLVASPAPAGQSVTAASLSIQSIS